MKKLLRIKGKGKSKEDRYGRKNGKEKNMCHIPGHHHEWKDCPNNPRNKKKQENNVNERDNDSDISINQEDYYLDNEHNMELEKDNS